MGATALWNSPLCYCLLALVLSSRSVSSSPPVRLLVVSFDGLRGDFLDRSLSTPNFHRLTSGSALFRRQIENVFPTQTFPNHFSISTGRYVEDHGVLASEVMDVESGTVLTYGPRLFHYDPQILPIWTLNERSKRRSGCMMWPACDVPFGGVNVTYSLSWNASMPWEERLSTALSWFKDSKKPANLVMMYFESPDLEEHIYGPNSPQTNSQIERADAIVGKLVTAVADSKLLDVNVVLLSDHGMEPVTLPRIYNLTGVLSKRGRAVGTSPVLQIYPEKGKTDELHSKLKALSLANHHFDVYLRKDIPDHFRYKNCRRAPPLLAVARPQYAFQDMYHWIDSYRVKYNLTVTNQTEFGVHGYDPKFPSMQPFLIAFGPKFKNQSQLPGKIVDLYGVFADVLGLEKPTDSPGAAHLSQIPVESINEPAIEIVFFSLASVVGLTTLFVVFVIFQRRPPLSCRTSCRTRHQKIFSKRIRPHTQVIVSKGGEKCQILAEIIDWHPHVFDLTDFGCPKMDDLLVTWQNVSSHPSFRTSCNDHYGNPQYSTSCTDVKSCAVMYWMETSNFNILDSSWRLKTWMRNFRVPTEEEAKCAANNGLVRYAKSKAICINCGEKTRVSALGVNHNCRNLKYGLCKAFHPRDA